MSPNVKPGDRLWVWKKLPPRVGGVVALNDPRQHGRVIVKRCVGVDGAAGTFTVVGDNQDASTDSRTFGPAPRSAYVGRVVYRYSPRERAGRVR